MTKTLIKNKLLKDIDYEEMKRLHNYFQRKEKKLKARLSQRQSNTIFDRQISISSGATSKC